MDFLETLMSVFLVVGLTAYYITVIAFFLDEGYFKYKLDFIISLIPFYLAYKAIVKKWRELK